MKTQALKIKCKSNEVADFNLKFESLKTFYLTGLFHILEFKRSHYTNSCQVDIKFMFSKYFFFKTQGLMANNR